jgi:hypothetical protein
LFQSTLDPDWLGKRRREEDPVLDELNGSKRPKKDPEPRLQDPPPGPATPTIPDKDTPQGINLFKQQPSLNLNRESKEHGPFQEFVPEKTWETWPTSSNVAMSGVSWATASDATKEVFQQMTAAVVTEA